MRVLTRCLVERRPILRFGNSLALFTSRGKPCLLRAFNFLQRRCRALAKRRACFQIRNVSDVTTIILAVENSYMVVAHSRNCGLKNFSEMRNEECFDRLLHISIVLIEAEGFGGDFFEFGAGDEVGGLGGVFKRVNGVLMVAEDERGHFDARPFAAVETGRVMEDAVEFEGGVLDTRALELRGERVGDLGPITQRLLIFEGLFEKVLTFSRAVGGNQPGNECEDFHVPRIWRIKPSRTRENEPEDALGKTQSEIE